MTAVCGLANPFTCPPGKSQENARRNEYEPHDAEGDNRGWGPVRGDIFHACMFAGPGWRSWDAHRISATPLHDGG